ncbi:MAG: site-2 protease family protein, partial [Candidatus Nitrosopolaris sp.]
NQVPNTRPLNSITVISALPLEVARIKGIPIKLHFTLVVVSFLVVSTLAVMLMPGLYPGLDIYVYWIMGIVGAIILFVSVLLHELAHSIVALRYGLKVREIVLYIFGGVSVIEDQDEVASKDFRKGFKIAIVGPITSFGIAGTLATVLWFLMYATLGSYNNSENVSVIVAAGVLQYGALVNALLGGFNLIPAFPLDGGRILRSALLRSKNDYDKSTKITARTGIAISYGFMGLGFFTMISGSYISGMWLLLIGWFLNRTTRSYLAQHQMRSILSGVRLGSIMNTHIIVVRNDMRIDNLIHEYLDKSTKNLFPVTDDFGHLVGVLATKDVYRVPEYRRNFVHIIDIMIQKSDLIIMNIENTVDDVLKNMGRKRTGIVFICDQEGKLIGMINKIDIQNTANERKHHVKVRVTSRWN